ncbi:hypothetical protein LK996_06600 [Lysobacter sp. A6]|uniref:Transmembrane protein n=1 Tax=Noviluteimonas lactosilytica TaxID=2888523 RepID=A0ABS8JGL9_9GAMM|nr:hypothetical protein [Lysobacter lactosilyticus]MCC8362744.1 hypothetical protein [Lysobacter lactosilyticus]
MIVLLLGWLGLFGIGAIPIRSWTIAKHAWGAARHRRRLLAALLLLPMVVMIPIDLEIAIRVHRCLASQYCGPSVASGWLYLAFLGLAYAVFEIAFLGVLITKRIKHHRMRLGESSS